MESISVFEVAEIDGSAQTNLFAELETYLQNLPTDKDDDHSKPVQSEYSPEPLASSLTIDEAVNLPRSLSVETAGCIDASYYDSTHQ